MDVDTAVVEGVKGYFTPESTNAVIKELRAILQERLTRTPIESQQLVDEARTLKREIDHLTVALASIDDKPSAVIQTIADKEKRLRHIDAQLATMESTVNTVDLERRRLEREAQRRLAEINAEFTASPEHARNVLGRLVGDDKVRFHPVNGRYVIEGRVAVPKLLLSGTAVPVRLASPAGFEPSSGDSTFQQACRGFARDSGEISLG